jgi:hypothetical protein
MSKRDEKLALYKQFIGDHKLNLDEDLLVKVTIGLGPSIYNKDSEVIACSQKSELERVRENYLKKKLGLTQSDSELDQAIEEICQTIGSSVKNKYRAVFYTLLAEKFEKQSVYA